MRSVYLSFWSRFSDTYHAMRRDQHGNFIIIFAMTASILTVIMGLGIDYYVAISDKTRLDSSADAAALAAVNAAKAYYAANSGTLAETILESNADKAGQTQGVATFNANIAATDLSAPITPSVIVTFAALQFTATVTYSGSVPSHFGSLVGISAIAVAGESVAVSTLPKYLDFYIVTDVSGSMGIPTSADDQQTLILTNPDNKIEAANYPTGCQFACHFPGYTGFAYTQESTVHIALKLNTVGDAIQGLLSAATTSKVIANQFRVGVYTFIVDAIQAAALSSNFTNATTVANNLANYIDNGTTNGGMNSGGTHFENLWNDLKQYFPTAGTGLTSSSTLPFIILITDGVENTQTFPFNGSWPQLPDNASSASFCASAKAKGYTVAVLYIPYSPIVDPQYIWNDEDYAVNYLIDPINSISPPSPYKPSVPSGQNLASNSEACASAGYFFNAGTAAEITLAMQKIFYQAEAQARLTQ